MNFAASEKIVKYYKKKNGDCCLNTAFNNSLIRIINLYAPLNFDHEKAKQMIKQQLPLFAIKYLLVA